MHKIISEFYRIFIRPIDPGLFITKYALKSIAACAVSLGLAYLMGMSGKHMQWCGYGSVALVLFRAGSTLAKRKIVAVILGLLLICLVPVSTFIGNYTFALEIYLFLLAFGVFFAPVLGVAAGTVGLGTLIVNLLALTSPDTFIAGLQRSGAIFFGASVVYIFIFHLWPLRPEKILNRAGSVALTDIGDYFRAVASSGGSHKDLQQLAEIHERTVESVRRYRGFMEAMNVDPVKDLGSYEGPSALYALLVRMIEAVVGLSNSRQFADHSAVFSDMRFIFSDIAGKSSVAFDVLAAKLSTGKGDVNLKEIDDGIADLESRLLRLGAYKRDDGLRDEFLEAWGAIYGLRNLSLEFAEMNKLCCSGGACSVR
ncbi:FUSC family membrane protein [Maridesulfovibrio zosterae]|uniref:FUSC family membrane protein n=1 Tax=Maridesulfovibrio zosterae TaxID=82171 RepID=UPI00047FF914|nr:FUSC family membrane protein [Maridesulfovibrio zosterae]